MQTRRRLSSLLVVLVLLIPVQKLNAEKNKQSRKTRSTASDSSEEGNNSKSEASGAVVVSILGRAECNGRVLRPGETVREGETIVTGESSELKLLLPDKSILDLGPMTQFRVESIKKGEASDRQIELSSDLGRARASVRKKLEKGGKFILRTRSSVLAVRGTEFFVETKDAGSSVDEEYIVTEGQVNAETKSEEKPLVLKSGNSINVTAERTADGYRVGSGQWDSSRIASLPQADLIQTATRFVVRDQSFAATTRVGDSALSGNPGMGRGTLNTILVTSNLTSNLTTSRPIDRGEVFRDTFPKRTRGGSPGDVEGSGGGLGGLGSSGSGTGGTTTPGPESNDVSISVNFTP